MTFHEKEYDGIVLKFPAWFIKLNGLEDTMQLLKYKLDTCNLSMYHPDHTSNLHELENYAGKLEFIKNAAELRSGNEIRRQDDYNKLLSGEVRVLEWRSESVCNENDRISYEDPNETDCLWDDIFTKGLSVKKSFIDKYKKNINTFEKFKVFIDTNFRFGNSFLYDTSEELIDWENANFYVSRYGLALQINVNLMNVQTDITNKKNKYQYRRYQLKSIDGVYCIPKGSREDWEKLDGYVRSGMKLIKK